ncbi:MAG: ABC transporter ATP-binding protein/permease [Desulfobacteraceae bacterium]|nr:ABC transporter ATP-binding protein/permease [Desulfobacteraceae bacterium]
MESRETKKSFLRQVRLLAGPYWNCPHRVKVRGATGLLLLLTMGQVGIAVWSNYWQRALFDALEQRTVRGVLVQVAVFAAIFAASIAVTGAHLLVKRWLQLDWRDWLTEALAGRWLEAGRHYRLRARPGEHDNPDQRIAEDIRIATESAVALAHTLVYSLMVLALFVDILWAVSGTLVVPGTNVRWTGYMVPLAFVYAGTGGVFGWMVGRPLVRATNALQTAEATFRFGLSRTREHAEEIALVHGEPMERTASSDRFRRIVSDYHRQSLAYLWIVSFGTGYGALLPVFPILIAAPQYIAGVMTLGVLMQAAQAFQRLTSALSWPVDNLGEIARCRASAERVLALHEALQRLDDDGRQAAPGIRIDRWKRKRIVIEDLCILEPSGRILLDHFCVALRRGERVLVAGDAEVTAKLFKVLGGLWPWGSGTVSLPDDAPIMLMPQYPFLPEGKLRDALCYPMPRGSFKDAEMRHALECTGLVWLAPRLETSDNWEEALPRLVRQRLGFARILLQRPGWVIMEEATNAFDPKAERLMFEMLRRELPNVGLLHISANPGLKRLHQRTVVLDRHHQARHGSMLGGKAPADLT